MEQTSTVTALELDAPMKKQLSLSQVNAHEDIGTMQPELISFSEV